MMRRLSLIAALLLLAACGLPGNVVVLLPDENGTVGKAEIRNAGSVALLDKGLEAVETRPGTAPSAVFLAKAEEVDAAFAGSLAATPRKPVAFIVYFLNAQAVLDPGSQPMLEQAVAAAKAQPNVDVSVVGHADATGKDAENLRLSLRRAETVRDVLVAAGVPPGVIEVTYHGANNPLVPSPPGVSEPRNRRVEVTIR